MNRTTWRKGQTGNPHGMPAWVREMRALAGAQSPRAIEVLVELMEHSEKDEVRVRAAEALLDRAGLKPYATEPDKVEVTGDVGDALGKLSALVARRLEAGGAAGGNRRADASGSGTPPASLAPVGAP